MTGVELIATGASGAALLGFVYTVWKNGRGQAKRDQQITDNQTQIINRLDDKKTGLTAINEKMHNFELNCAIHTERFDGRILATERDIKELKASKKYHQSS